MSPQMPPNQGNRISKRGANYGIPSRDPNAGGFLLEKLMGSQRDDRLEAQQRWGGSGNGSRILPALRLQAQMRPRFFQRDFYGPATDKPGQDLLRCLVQVG
jgi:hypothetical protein